MGYWGPHPARADSNTVRPVQPGDPAWQTAVLVPYHIVGVPLTMLDKAGKGALSVLDRLGLFRATEQVVAGVKDPLGNYWLPDIGYGDAQGWRFGAQVRRPFFPLHGMITKFRFLASTTNAVYWALGAIMPLQERGWYELGGGSVVLPREKFYGTGYDTTDEDRSYYHRSTDWFGMGWRRPVSRYFSFEVLGHYSAVEASRSRYNQDQALEDVWADDLPFGYGETSAGLTGGLQLVADSSTEAGRPEEGTRLLVFTQFYEPTDSSDTRFWTSGVSLEQYLNLGYPQRNLALKGWYLREKPMARQSVPFTRLLRNRVPYQLRGYSSSRFLARGMVGGSVEYRWPVWTQNRPEQSGVDAYVFGDAGQPFDHSAEIALDNLFWSAGFGLRIINNRHDFVLRLELAGGEEGLQARLTTNQLFQFVKAGFYDGSDPIPVLR
jgi:hypothetical protein